MLNRIRHKIIGPLIIIWLLLTVVGMALRAPVWNKFKASLEASAESMRLQQSLGQLLSHLQEAESSQRGFLLTSNNAYLQAFKEAEAALLADFTQLSGTAPDPGLQEDLMKLRGLTDSKMSEMKETIQLREKNLNAAIALVNSNQGKKTMDQIHKLMFQMVRDRQNLYSSEWEITRLNFERAEALGVALGIFGLGAGLVALYLARVSFLQEKDQLRLWEAKLRAEKTAGEKSAFLANMSHEIRTPMNAVLGFSELLEGERLTPKQAQYVRSIRASGTALLELINNVLDLSKMEAGKLELRLEPTDLQETFAFLRTMFAQQAMVKSLNLKFEAQAVPHALLLDRLRLRQLLINLIGNAIKFTGRGEVSVRAQWEPNPGDRSRGSLLLEVKDTGLGISPAKQQEIFKPFVQSNISRNLEHQGTGLGLSIAQRIAQLMNGSITLESAEGVGSTFRVKLADVEISARLPASDLTEPAGAADFNDFAPALVLVVDDNLHNRELIAGLFEGTHHQLMMAADGREALQRIAEKKPDLVLMDIRMPVMDGRAALEEIRQREGLELLPVIAVTASSQPDDEQNVRARFSGFLRKPFARQHLHGELAQFLPRATRKNEPSGGGGASGPAAPPGVMATARSADQGDMLVAELRLLQRTRWPGLRDSLAINETAAFARQLKELSKTLNCLPLASYAEQLATHADAYSVKDLEKQLAEFPTLIQSLEPRKNH